MELLANINFNKWVSKRGISGSALKMIAFATMLVDHAAILLFPHTSIYKFLRIIGRVAFPIFCFLISEGLIHSSDKLRYLIRILLFGFLCQAPYALAFGNGGIFADLNIYFTFAFSMLPIVLFLIISSVLEKKFSANVSKLVGAIAFFLCLIIIWQASKHVKIEYGLWGVGLTIVFYVSKPFKPFDIAVVGLYMLYIWRGSAVQLCALMSLPLILFYNGQRGFVDNTVKKISCYAFYPVHILLLYGISLLIK